MVWFLFEYQLHMLQNDTWVKLVSLLTFLPGRVIEDMYFCVFFLVFPLYNLIYCHNLVNNIHKTDPSKNVYMPNMLVLILYHVLVSIH